MSRIPKIGFSGPLKKEPAINQENNMQPPAKPLTKKTSGSNLAGFKRPSDERLNLVGKRQKTDSGVLVKNKVLSTIQHSDITSKSVTAQRTKKNIGLQPLPDTGLERCSMPAQLPSTKIKIPGKPKRPAWDLKGRLQDMEEHLLHNQQESTRWKEELEKYNQRIAVLESANSSLCHDVQVKSEQSEEAISQIKKLERQLKQKTDEYDSLAEETEKQIKKLEEKLSNLQNEYDNLKNVYQQETGSLRSTIVNLSCMKSGIEAELAANKIIVESQQKEISQLKNTCSVKDSENESLHHQLCDMEAKLREGESLRRKLHNTVQELKGNIRVFCRMRPPLPEEIKTGMTLANIVSSSEKSIEIQQLTDSCLNESDSKSQPKYDFSFDAYFPPSASQEKIFNEISQLVQSALDGYNVCIFAYGQTGSGKTFTMEGPADVVDFSSNKDNPDLGMIPRSVQQIFSTIAELQPKGWKYKIETVFLEIYNERIQDLLNSQRQNTKCEIVKSGNKGTDCIISNVKTSEVTSSEQVFELLKKARINRAVAATKCNEYSSRSHFVFQMKIYGENSITGEKCDGTLNLVDLAGSERVKDSESAGERLTEAKAINKSLSNLGKVIMSLSRKENHIPYRDSKLTHILANSLGGNSKTLMFVNISPDNKNLSETINSLRFATKVNQCNIGTAQKRVK